MQVQQSNQLVRLNLAMVGCQTCRTRRVKCDGVEPICRNCTRLGRNCVKANVKKSTTFAIHVENEYASGKTKRPRGPRAVQHAFKFQTDHWSLTVLPSLTLDLETRAVAMYLNMHLHPISDLPDMLQTLASYVPGAWNSLTTTKDPLIHLGVSSTALATFARTQRNKSAAVEATRRYRKLLRCTKSLIPALTKENVDTCLLVVFLMGRYEDAIYRPGIEDSTDQDELWLQCFWHHNGAMAILKAWRDRFGTSMRATATMKQSRRGLVRSALLRSLQIPEWMADGATFGERGLELEYDRVVVQLANLRHHLSVVLRQAKDYPSGVESNGLMQIASELNTRSQEIDDMVLRWGAGFPDEWVSQQHEVTQAGDLPRRHLYSSNVYSYSSPAHAAIWNKFSATRLLVNATRHQILELLRSLKRDLVCFEQQEQCISTVKLMSDDLSRSILYSLGRLAFPNGKAVLKADTPGDIEPHLAILVTWPLCIASSLKAVDPLLREWFTKELSYLGSIVGAGVMEHVETEKCFRL